jgi:hypothetical protein
MSRLLPVGALFRPYWMKIATTHQDYRAIGAGDIVVLGLTGMQPATSRGITIPTHTRRLLATGVIEIGDGSIGDRMHVTHGTMETGVRPSVWPETFPSPPPVLATVAKREPERPDRFRAPPTVMPARGGEGEASE